MDSNNLGIFLFSERRIDNVITLGTFRICGGTVSRGRKTTLNLISDESERGQKNWWSEKGYREDPVKGLRIPKKTKITESFYKHLPFERLRTVILFQMGV